MYATCLFCNAALGTNTLIERFPVGRRLAFDAACGRLWVVCPTCGRWNLTPLEERWEAIEVCERSFRATTLRASTGEIGLARAGDGTELVRVGQPLRPEMAAWRYARFFASRRRARALRIGGVAAACVGFSTLASVVGIGDIAWMLCVGQIPLLGAAYANRNASRVARLRVGIDGRAITVTRELAARARLRWLVEDEWALDVPVIRRPGARPRVETFVGADAERVMRRLLPRVNGMHDSASAVASAVAVLEDAGSTDRVFRLALRHDVQSEARRATAKWATQPESGTLTALPPAVRLALEMASHEETERRALDGDLAQLAHAWREAEEIASIADGMLLPDQVSERLTQLKRDS